MSLAHLLSLRRAIAGDKIDDVWAQEVLDLAYDESTLALGPYRATHGSGFLDILATMSLDDGGGAQAGSAGSLGSNLLFYAPPFLYASDIWDPSIQIHP
jgi:hypothetical protein